MLRWISIWKKEKKMTRNSLSTWQVSFRLWLTEKWKMRTSIECRKTNTNVITTANENSRLQQANCLKRRKTRETKSQALLIKFRFTFHIQLKIDLKVIVRFRLSLKLFFLGWPRIADYLIFPFILRHLRTPSSLSFLLTLNGTWKLLLGFS